MYEKLSLSDMSPTHPIELTLVLDNSSVEEVERTLFIDAELPELEGCEQYLSCAYVCEFEDELQDTLTDLLLDCGIPPDELYCYRGVIYPAKTLPVDRPEDIADYDTVLVISTEYGDNKDCASIAELSVYDSDQIKNYIESLSMEASIYAHTGFEDEIFNIDNMFVFVGKTMSLKATASEGE